MNFRQFIEMLGAFSAMYLSLAFIICISLVISDGESGKNSDWFMNIFSVACFFHMLSANGLSMWRQYIYDI